MKEMKVNWMGGGNTRKPKVTQGNIMEGKTLITKKKIFSIS